MTGSDAIPSFEPLIDLYASQGRWPEVRQYAQEWLKNSPLDSTAHYWAAWASMRIGEMKAAEEHARAMSIDGLNGWRTAFLWAEIRLAQGEVNSALTAIRHALELAPGVSWCYHTLSRVHLRRGENQQALEAIETALRLEPDNPTSQKLHGIVHRAATNAWTPAAAADEIRVLKQVLALDPRDAWVLARIGKIYATELFGYHEAVDFFRQSLEVNPTDAEVRHDLLEAQLRQDGIYRWLTSPLPQLGYYDTDCPHWRVPWILLPFVFYAVTFLAFGALFNLLWLWLPSQFYRHFVRAELCRGEAGSRWQRSIYRHLMRVPSRMRLLGWSVATLVYWCVQFLLLVLYAVFLFVPTIILGTLSWYVVWRTSHEARRARKQLI